MEIILHFVLRIGIFMPARSHYGVLCKPITGKSVQGCGYTPKTSRLSRISGGTINYNTIYSRRCDINLNNKTSLEQAWDQDNVPKISVATPREQRTFRILARATRKYPDLTINGFERRPSLKAYMTIQEWTMCQQHYQNSLFEPECFDLLPLLYAHFPKYFRKVGSPLKLFPVSTLCEVLGWVIKYPQMKSYTTIPAGLLIAVAHEYGVEVVYDQDSSAAYLYVSVAPIKRLYQTIILEPIGEQGYNSQRNPLRNLGGPQWQWGCIRQGADQKDHAFAR